ncbi:MAG: hypothetical protein Q7S54_00775 [bacterium]|nr:hypothetical protein [bacterium]
MKKTFILIAVYFLMFGAVLAQTTPAPPTEYKLLAPIPLNGPEGGVSETTNTRTFIPGLFRLIIGIATALAVVRIIFGGIQYMSTDAFGEKSEAKNIIEGALFGLMLALSAWLILNTINPDLVNFNLNITPQEIKSAPIASVTGEDITLPAGCPNCVTLGVPHKNAPIGCAPPGPCTINSELNNKLVALNKLNGFYVTESFPPTVVHKDPCHLSGTCVDATISSNSPSNIKIFIDNANYVGLRAVFEVANATRAQQIRNASGLSASQVIVVPTINNEHFSVYSN